MDGKAAHRAVRADHSRIDAHRQHCIFSLTREKMLDPSLFLCNITITRTFLISQSVIVLLNNSMGACNKNSIHLLQIFPQKYFPVSMKATLCAEECELSPAVMGARALRMLIRHFSTGHCPCNSFSYSSCTRSIYILKISLKQYKK